MGSSSSKAEKKEALRLCKERRRLIKQSIDSRYDLAASHVSYIDSLKNVGVALRRLAEAEVLIESSLSTTSATELDKTPSHSSCPSPSPPHLAEVSDIPLHNESPISPPEVNLSYMRVGGRVNAVTFKVNLNNSSSQGFVEDELGLSVPQPPPPPFESGGSWDYFDPSDDCEGFRFAGQNELDAGFGDMKGWDEHGGEWVGVDQSVANAKEKCTKVGFNGDSQVKEGILSSGFDQNCLRMSDNLVTQNRRDGLRLQGVAHSHRLMQLEGFSGQELDKQLETMRNANSSKREKAEAGKNSAAEKEDPAEFISHRPKDFFSSIKDIEHRFFRASESGKEMSRMLESNNIRVGYAEIKGSSSASVFSVALQLVCCRKKTALMSEEPVERITKVITWKRTTSSRSSSSRNPLFAAAKDDVSDNGSDFIEEFCMISGSHSSTLDRIYAWERKLHDEVKASDSIRKVYDRKCDQLRRQFAKDQSVQALDKTRAVVKDLHSQLRVSIHSVDSISKRIEKMRDDELQPQLLELIQGLIRMWKAMLDCHHAQCITISLAYNSRSTTGTSMNACRQIMGELQQEIECFGLSFANWVNSLAFYVEAINGWLQNCIMQPREHSRNKRPFSPRRVLAPPIFVLCQYWSAGIKALPSVEVSNAIRAFLSDLNCLMYVPAERVQKNDQIVDADNGESEGKDDKNGKTSSNMCCIHASLTKVLDKLTKFSDASLKMYDDIRQKCEAAGVAYQDCKQFRY